MRLESACRFPLVLNRPAQEQVKAACHVETTSLSDLMPGSLLLSWLLCGQYLLVRKFLFP